MDSGQLGTVATADLLHRYAAAGATGCLRLRHAAMEARVYFRDGLVYAATAPGARARLGDRLVGAEHITEEELTATLEHQRSLSEPRRIGELLIERGLLDRDTMRTYVREQSTDSVALTLGWQDGAWTFTEGEETPEDIPLDLSVENLVMEGARRLEEWAVIQARIGSVEAVPDFVAGDGSAELALTPDEWSMLTRIDGRSTIAEIAEEAGYSEFDAGRIIYGLLTAGIVTLIADEEEAAREEPVGEAEAPETPAWPPTRAEPADWRGEPAPDWRTAEPQPSPEPDWPAASEPAAGPDWPAAPEPAAGPDWGTEPEPPAQPEPEPTAQPDWRTEPEPTTQPDWRTEPEPPAEAEAGAAEHDDHDDARVAYSPSEASQLFGELGLGEAGTEPSESSEEVREGGEPEPAGEEPTARPEERRDTPAQPPAGAGEQVNRNELLREFAALDDASGEGGDDSRPPRPARPPRREDDKDKRKGLFGRLRRD